MWLQCKLLLAQRTYQPSSSSLTSACSHGALFLEVTTSQHWYLKTKIVLVENHKSYGKTGLSCCIVFTKTVRRGRGREVPSSWRKTKEFTFCLLVKNLISKLQIFDVMILDAEQVFKGNFDIWMGSIGKSVDLNWQVKCLPFFRIYFSPRQKTKKKRWMLSMPI